MKVKVLAIDSKGEQVAFVDDQGHSCYLYDGIEVETTEVLRVNSQDYRLNKLHQPFEEGARYLLKISPQEVVFMKISFGMTPAVSFLKSDTTP